VEVVRSATNLFPAKALWPGIVEVVGDQPDDLDRFRRVCLGWMASGWNPKNVKGMLQFHARKEIPGDNHNGQGARASPANEPVGFAGIREWCQAEGIVLDG